MTLPNSSVQLTFSDSGGDAADESLSLSLDGDRNQEVYGQSKTTFAPGEVAYLKLMRSSSAAYQMHSSAGVVSVQATNIPYAFDENITFLMTTSSELQYIPNGAVDFQWMGRDPDQEPLVNRRTVSIPSPAVAVLHCEYDSLGDRLRLHVTNSAMGSNDQIQVSVLVVQGEQTASLNVTYALGGSNNEPVPIDLEVRDFCSDEIVEDVEVFLDGTSMGTTNLNGKIYLGELVPGSVHQLRMTKSGYIDSDLDVLYNDEFTVPSS